MTGKKADEKTAHRLFVTGLLASTVLSPLHALAQTTAPALETVVVTAEKRSEDIQKAALSITALSDEKLDQLQIEGFNDYVKFLPSVSYSADGPGTAEVYFRGVASGENGNHSGPLPSVGVYLDEQPVTTIGGTLDPHIYDIERIEALAGPQGTLYGASSQAGTLRIITNKPDPSGFSAAYEVDANAVSHGSFGGYAEGYVNIPVAENAAIRIVAWNEHDAGYIDNIGGTNVAAGIIDGVRTFPTATDQSELEGGGPITSSDTSRFGDDYNSVDNFGTRAALKIDLDNNWTVTPSIMGQYTRSYGEFSYDPGIGYLKITHFLPEWSNDKWYQAALTVEGKLSYLDVTYAGAYMDRAITSRLDYADYSFFYDDIYGTYFRNDAGEVINPSQAIWGRDHFTKLSNEIRVSSPAEDRFRFVAGLFQERQTHFIESRYVIQDLESDFWVTSWPDTIWLTEQLRVDRDYAAFAEMSYDVTPQLTFTGGVRAFIANNSLGGFYGYGAGYSSSYGEAQCGDPPVPFRGAPCTDFNKHVYETGYTHKLNATYHIDDDKMVYATWSTGFRPGGVNRNGSLPPYTSDFLTNYEFGWKTSWADNAVRFNGALFREDWDKIQFSTIPPLSAGLTQIFNAGSARIWGVESNVDWLVSEAFTLSAGATYVDAYLTKDYCLDSTPCTPGETPDAAKGTQLPVTPRFKANAVGRYEFRWGDYNGHLQSALVYNGSAWPALIASDRATLGKMPDYFTADFSAGIGLNNWTLELYIDNAFDSHGQNNRFDQCAICTAQVYVTPIEPRLIGLKFAQKF